MANRVLILYHCLPRDYHFINIYLSQHVQSSDSHKDFESELIFIFEISMYSRVAIFIRSNILHFHQRSVSRIEIIIPGESYYIIYISRSTTVVLL